ncbi:MAG: SPASM domain-containing protein [Oscillospiraceae bacterium]|jgi:MoaA/NifB/PqqE/SkfB family radical SAM enzyme|nr:SPASM domain-containing protein [Oscillospiraceae bacterium]
MKAKFAPRIDTNRTKLVDVLPLDTPYSIYIDPASSCNFACGFCACGRANIKNWAEHRKVGLMDFNLFTKVIDDISCFPDKVKAIHLYKEGEPLLNPRLPEMVEYVKRKEVTNRVDFVSNVSLLTHEKSLQLIEAGLDRINISIEGMDDDLYEKNAGVRFSFEKIVDNVRFFYEHKKNSIMLVKIPDSFLGNYTQQQFFDTFGDICDEIAIEYPSGCWPEFEYDTGGVPIKTVSGLKTYSNNICPTIFYGTTVNSDGTVSACYVDWNRKVLVGDAKNESLVDIWNGEKLRDLRLRHLRLELPNIPVCQSCNEVKLNQIETIDCDREEILKIFN